MEIRRLSLRNIRSYERAELDLPSGTTLIAGDVGSGKTSLLYAVEMALFGFAAVDAPFLVRHGAVHAEVSVTLEGGGHMYEVGRRFKRVNRKGRDSFEIERLTFAQDGARTAYSATELRQRVIELFGFPDNPNPRSHSDLWRWAVYVPQERMREVLSQDPQERLETVRRALGIERYRLAAENAQDIASELRQLGRFRREESDRLDHWESELVERSQELEQFEVRSVGLAEAVGAAEAELAERQQAREEAESALRSFEGDRREQESLEREQRHDEEQVAALDRGRAGSEAELARESAVGPTTLVELERRVTEAGGTLERLGAEREELQRSRATTESRVRELIQARTDVEALARAGAERARDRSAAVEELHAAEAELERARSDGPSREPPEPTPRALSTIEEELVAARREERAQSDQEVRAKAELEEVVSLLAAGECPRCHQAVKPEDFSHHRDEASEALRRASERTRSSADTVARLEEERKARERFERARERWQEAERRRTETTGRVRAVAARVEAIEESSRREQELLRTVQERVASLLPVLETEKAELASQGRVDAEIKDATRRLDGMRAAQQRAKEDSLRRERLTADHERVVRDLIALRGRIQERETRIEGLRARTARLLEMGDVAGVARGREQGARQRLETLRVDRARVEQDATNARRRRHEAQQGVEERSKLVRESRELEAKASWLAGPFREALLAMEQRILAQAQAAFQRDFGRFFRALIDDPLLEARVGAGFDPTVLINGEWTPAEALSGGERTALALAFRLALGRVVRTMGSLRLDTLILDEPTDGFSPEQIVRMGELLRGLGLPQVILVSHESQLSSVADHVAEAVKVNGRSEIRVVGRPVPPGPPTAAVEMEATEHRLRARPHRRAPKQRG